MIVLISVWCRLVNVLSKPALVVRRIRRPAIGIVAVGVARIPFLKTWNSISHCSSTTPAARDGCGVVKVKVGVDIGCSVTIAVQQTKILFAGQVKPVDHAFFEQRVQVGGVVTGITGDLVFPRVVPIGSTKEENGG